MRLFSLAAVASVAAARPCAPFQNLVTFGDSYTDDGRLAYYTSHGGHGPPPGVYQTVTNITASGGLAWGQYVQENTGVNYYDYAIGGATCSGEIVSRGLAAIRGQFPSVIDDEIPSFEADIHFKSMYADRTADNTVYALWIGTNDLGVAGLLADSQAPGAYITTFVQCIW